MSVIEAPSGHAGRKPAVRPGRHDLVLSTKLAFPPLPPDVLPRPRLLDLVRGGTAGPLTLVSAPAGSGKTTLVAAWAAEDEIPETLTWVTLEQGDEQPGRFWAYVVEGLRRSGVRGLPEPAPAPGGGSRRSMLLQVAARVAAHERPVVLVLDNADRVPDPVLWREIGELLAHAGDDLRLVLLTRRDPSLPLPQLRLDGALTEIRMADLAFTRTEAQAFLECAGLHLGARELDALLERTGGWPAGIRFAAMSLVGRSDLAAAVAQFGSAEGNAAEYLFTEVLDQTPPVLREVLLRSSVVDVLRPGLLEAVTGAPEGRRTLDFVARGNAFLLPVPGTTGCYRYQPLFRDLLRAQLAYEQPALVPELHRAAARWLADHDELLEATSHAVAGGDWEAATGFVVDALAVGRLLAGPGDEDLRGMLRALPDSEAGTAAALVRTALALHGGDLPAARCQLDAAQTALDGEPAARARNARVAVAALGALVAERDADLEDALRAARVADRVLAAAGAPGAAPELWAEVGLCRARLLIRQRDVGLARAVLDEVVEVGGSAGCSDLAAGALGLAALLEAVSGRLRHAVGLVRAQADPDERPGGGNGPAPSVPAAVVALAWVHLERFDVQAARGLVCRAELLTNRSYDPVTAAALATLQARLPHVRREVPAPTVPGTATEPVDRRWLVPRGVPADPVDGDPRSAVVAGLVRQAERAARRGDPERARGLLAQALDHAAPEHLRRPFLQAPAPVQELVRQGTVLDEAHPWLHRATPGPTLHPVTPAPVGHHGSVRGGLVVEPLTPKEQEVLRHLGELLTTEEIAAAMFVSVNTVRTHVRSVLRKLAVTRRHEAVRRAWELGLLQRPDAV